MSDVRRFSTTAIIALVMLRIGIGWQLLYEGLWKIDTLDSQQPWTSDGYLKSSLGPMRNFFRSVSGDPDNTQWLDPDAVLARWTDWQNRFVSHYGLDQVQQSALNGMIHGPADFRAALPVLPAGVDLTAVRDKAIQYDADSKQLIVDGRLHLLPSEHETLQKQVAGRSEPEVSAYLQALDVVFKRSSRLSYGERVRAHLQGNQLIAGKENVRVSEIALYNQMRERYEGKLQTVSLPFQQEHLDRLWADIRSKDRELAGPVLALDVQLRDEAMNKVLTLDQLQRGSLPRPWDTLRVVDTLTIAGLTGLGLLLIFGLFSRFAALMAALMVFGFYMAMPPWPGVPEVPGPEHSFIVNKNLIEVLALLALATIPTGRWFGLDIVASRLCGRRPVSREA